MVAHRPLAPEVPECPDYLGAVLTALSFGTKQDLNEFAVDDGPPIVRPTRSPYLALSGAAELSEQLRIDFAAFVATAPRGFKITIQGQRYIGVLHKPLRDSQIRIAHGSQTFLTEIVIRLIPLEA